MDYPIAKARNQETAKGSVQRPNQRPDDVLNNTVFGGNDTALPGAWTLSGPHNPWLDFNR